MRYDQLNEKHFGKLFGIIYQTKGAFKEAKILETTQLSWKTNNKHMEQNTVPNHQVFKNQFRFIRVMKGLGLLNTTHELCVAEVVKRKSFDLWNLLS